MNIEEFAKLHSLEWEIGRRTEKSLPKFWANFKHAETKRDESDRFLGFAFGSGDTVKSAKADYVREIQGKLLVIDAGDRNLRRTIQVKGVE